MSPHARRPRWTEADIPDQTGRTAVVTGANTGIGYETTRILAQRGAAVVLACRDDRKAAAAATRIRADVPSALIRTVHLDLASLASVRVAAAQLRAEHPHIDLLIHNAGCMRLRHELTEDGYEHTFATNHLGPFLLTGLLIDRLTVVPGSRIVAVTSWAHRLATLNTNDLHGQRGYRPLRAYLQSKLANLLTAYELQRRLTASGARTISVAAHPGNCGTEFGRDLNPVIRAAASPRLRWLRLFQTPAMGALAPLRAAGDPAAIGGDYYGPAGLSPFTGHPEKITSSTSSHDQLAQHWLWRQSERMTGVVYPLRSS